ncbi:transcriptional regulator [Pseudomonas syringae]|nr:transcriptional regulator [Pseudomonas syringae]MCF5071183.1 transcriptional regulator [Pseudomonas syringae]
MTSLNDSTPAAVLHFGPYAFHLRQRLILDGDRQLRMGGRALDILQVLVERAGRVVSKEQLIARVWPSSVVEEINLRVHIAALRRALGDGENGQQYIVNVPQCGYCFVAPVRSDSVAPSVFESLQAPQHNLPARLTPVIGRDSLIGAMVGQLPLCRLMTVSGPAGVGKSTVALRAAELLLQHFEDGVWRVDLSVIDDTTPLLDHVLQTLDTDLATLATRHTLLVLDSCEHVRTACRTLIERLLDMAPRLSILATSREALRLSQETVQHLAPLCIPDVSMLRDVNEAMAYSAVQLFVSRARARQHDFVLREQDLPVVADICQGLDGLPLAIELAAAQVDAFALVGLRAQLSNGLQLLSHGRRTAVPRHQSLKAALNWSYQRLSDSEQALLQRLSVFEAAFTLEAAMNFMNGVPPRILDELIERLVTTSLLTVEQGGGVRTYRLLATTRHFVQEHQESCSFDVLDAPLMDRHFRVSDTQFVAQGVDQ